MGWILISRIDLEIDRENREINLELVDCYSWPRVNGILLLEKANIEQGSGNDDYLDYLLIVRIRSN